MNRHLVKHGDKAIIGNQVVRFGTVRGYAAEYGEDQDAAVERATENGHDLYWISLDPVVLSSYEWDKQQQREFRATAQRMQVGDVVAFTDAGVACVIEAAPNRNFGLRRLPGVAVGIKE